MWVKTHNYSGASREDAVVKGILYAADRGAQVINCSWGGAPEAAKYSQILFDAIKYAGSKNALLVISAGNDSSNIDNKPTYPASYDLPNILAIASTDSRDNLSSFSNYGQKSVHIAAPGSSIYSVRKGGNYTTMSGTSMASPHASGAAALFISWTHGQASFSEIKSNFMQKSEPLPSLRGKVASGFMSLNFLEN